MAELIPLPPSDYESSSASNSVRSESSGLAYQHLIDAESLVSQGHLGDAFDEFSSDGTLCEISIVDSELLDTPTRPTLQRLFNEGFDDVEKFQVKIGEEIRFIARDELLDFFWTNRAETTCMVCQGDFNDCGGPPVRTYSLHSPELPEGEDSVSALARLVVQLHNRHLHCIVESSSIKIVPHRDAVALSWFVPIRILNSATRVFKLDDDFQQVEIWHDYLIVPQWNYTVQQQLLLYLPAIFKAASTTLIHLEDIPESVLVTAFDRNATPYDMARSMYEFLVSHWFRRLWVALEYISSAQSCLMIEEAKIIRNEVGEPLNSFHAIVHYFQMITREISIQEGPQFANFMYNKYPNQIHWLYSSFHPKAKRIPLGEVYSFVCRLNCRDYRDRFIAITGLLGLGDYTEVSKEIPADTTEACFWVAWKCLERGDYTPLLLIPTGETEVPHARWLRGHENMARFMWTAGNINQDAENLKIIQNERIEPELEYV